MFKANWTEWPEIGQFMQNPSPVRISSQSSALSSISLMLQAQPSVVEQQSKGSHCESINIFSNLVA